MRPLMLVLTLALLTGCSSVLTMQRAGSTDDDRRIALAACERDARIALNAPTPQPRTSEQLVAGLATDVAGAVVPAMGPLFTHYDPEDGVRAKAWRCMRAGGWR